MCPGVRFAGHGSADGALRTCLAWPERLAHALPDGLSDVEGSLLEPLGVALHALDLEAAGEDAALADAIGAVRPGGRVVLVGIPEGDRTSFTASTARRKGLTLVLCRRMKPADLPRAIRLAEAGEVDLGGLVSARYALSEWRDACDDLVERRGLKVVVEPQRAGGSP